MDELWSTLTLEEQIGNIGSELSRMLTFERQGERQHWSKARQRAVELIDLTLRDQRWSTLEKKEVTKLKQLLLELNRTDSQTGVSIQELVNYCLPFAIVARSNR